MTTKQDHPTLVLIDREWRRLNSILEGLSSEEMERPAFDPEFGTDLWTVKDLLVHMAGWKRNVVKVIDKLHSDPSSVPAVGTPDEILEIDYERFNRDMHEQWAARPVSDALAEHREAHEQLRASLDSLPPEAIPLPSSRNIWPYPAIWHVKLHRLDIIDALER